MSDYQINLKDIDYLRVPETNATICEHCGRQSGMVVSDQDLLKWKRNVTINVVITAFNTAEEKKELPKDTARVLAKLVRAIERATDGVVSLNKHYVDDFLLRKLVRDPVKEFALPWIALEDYLDEVKKVQAGE